MFDTKEEAEQKLYDTVVMFDGNPVHITGVTTRDNKPSLGYYKICEKNPTSSFTDIDDPNWDFKNLGGRLGYTDVVFDGRKQAVYTRRVPVRKAHRTQGLGYNNVKIDPLRDFKKLGLRGMSLNFGHLLTQPGFKSTLKKQFKSLNEAKSALEKDEELLSTSFDKNLALRRSPLGFIFLDYKGKEVGYTEDCHTFRVPKEFRYLDELFIEDHKMQVK